MLWKCCTQYANKFGKLNSDHRTGKSHFSFQSQRKAVPKNVQEKKKKKECSNYCTIALISHASKVMLKILQTCLQQYVNHELPDIQAGFRKGRDILLNFLSCMWSLILNYPWKTFSQLERFAQELVIKWESKENRQLAQRYHEFPLKKIPRELHYVLWMIYVIFHLSRA